MRTLRTCLFLAVFSSVGVAPAVTQTNDLAFMYQMKVEMGSEMAFESAWKEHLAFREANGEPFNWQVFQVVFGDQSGAYLIRSGSHSWADMDSYGSMPDFQQSAGNHFGATVGPLIAEVSSQISVLDTAMSHVPPNVADMNVFMITQVHADASAQMEMEEALAAYHQTATANDRYHGVIRTIAGGSGSSFTIVAYAENFAGLEEESPSMTQLMIEEHGEDDFQDIAQAWLSGVGAANTSVIMLRRDLSSGSGN